MTSDKDDDKECSLSYRGGSYYEHCIEDVDNEDDANEGEDNDVYEPETNIRIVCNTDPSSSEDDDGSTIITKTVGGTDELYKGQNTETLFEDSVIMEESGDLSPQEAHARDVKSARLDTEKLIVKQTTTPC